MSQRTRDPLLTCESFAEQLDAAQRHPTAIEAAIEDAMNHRGLSDEQACYLLRRFQLHNAREV